MGSMLARFCARFLVLLLVAPTIQDDERTTMRSSFFFSLFVSFQHFHAFSTPACLHRLGLSSPAAHASCCRCPVPNPSRTPLKAGRTPIYSLFPYCILMRTSHFFA